MNKLQKQRNVVSIRTRVKQLPSAVKFYFMAGTLGIVIELIIATIYAPDVSDLMLTFIIEILIFLVIYIVITTVVISLSPRYNQDRNVIAVVIPALMIICGQEIAYLIVINSYRGSSPSDIIYYALVATLLVPIISLVTRAISHSPWKLYLSSLALVIISALIVIFGLRNFF